MSNRYVPVDSGVFDKVTGRVAPFPDEETDEVVTELNIGVGVPFTAYWHFSAVEHYQSLPHNEGKRFVQHYKGVLDTETGLVARLSSTPEQWLVDMFNEGCYDHNLEMFLWGSVQEEGQTQ